MQENENRKRERDGRYYIGRNCEAKAIIVAKLERLLANREMGFEAAECQCLIVAGSSPWGFSTES